MVVTSTATRPASTGARGRLADFRHTLSTADRRSLVAMASFVVLLHVVGFGILLGLVAPQH
jgi:high-affinity nickel-transport protein